MLARENIIAVTSTKKNPLFDQGPLLADFEIRLRILYSLSYTTEGHSNIDTAPRSQDFLAIVEKVRYLRQRRSKPTSNMSFLSPASNGERRQRNVKCSRLSWYPRPLLDKFGN